MKTMKKFYVTLMLGLFALPSVSQQTTLVPGAAAIIKSRTVVPVRVVGYTDYFYFDGYGGQIPACFSVDSGEVRVDTCSRFSLEFASFLNSDANAPLYYIRRTDGKFLSFDRGHAAFLARTSNSQLRFQQWLISKVKSEYDTSKTNAYNLLLPLAPSPEAYVLKILDSGKEIGFSINPKVLASESEIYLGQIPRKDVNAIKKPG